MGLVAEDTQGPLSTLTIPTLAVGAAGSSDERRSSWNIISSSFSIVAVGVSGTLLLTTAVE
jgi:hypothetical protein